jgi:hypothetical protein
LLRAIEEREDTTRNLKRNFFRSESISKNGLGLDRCRQRNHRRGWWYAVGPEIKPRGDRNRAGNVLEEIWRVVEGNAPIAQRVLTGALERIAGIAQQ